MDVVGLTEASVAQPLSPSVPKVSATSSITRGEFSHTKSRTRKRMGRGGRDAEYDRQFLSVVECVPSFDFIATSPSPLPCYTALAGWHLTCAICLEGKVNPLGLGVNLALVLGQHPLSLNKLGEVKKLK